MEHESKTFEILTGINKIPFYLFVLGAMVISILVSVLFFMNQSYKIEMIQLEMNDFKNYIENLKLSTEDIADVLQNFINENSK